MHPLLAYAAICVVPAGVLYGLSRGLQWLSQHQIQLTPARPMASSPSLERLVDDLRRLEHDYRRIERSDLPARAHRLLAVSLAYDDTLRACCRALELPLPEAPPLSSIDRLEVEADLAQHGLTW